MLLHDFSEPIAIRCLITAFGCFGKHFAEFSVYPDLFEDIDITEKTNEITEMFLGEELADAVFSCPSSFGGYQKIDTATFFA